MNFLLAPAGVAELLRDLVAWSPAKFRCVHRAGFAHRCTEHMATCPRCLGPLTDDHRCPRSRSRDRAISASFVLLGALAGAIVCYGLVDRPHTLVVCAFGALGGLLVGALRQAVNPRA